MTLDLAGWAALVPSPDASATAAARARQDTLTKPSGALGRLESVSLWLAGVQGRCPTIQPSRVRVVVFAADHGMALAGVSAYPAEVTGQMLANMREGGAAVNVLARQCGATIRLVSLCDEYPRTGRIDREDAMTAETAEAALRLGAEIADEEVDGGADLLIPGDMGIGNTTPATALIGLLTGAEPAQIVGRGTGIDDVTYARKQGAIIAAAGRASGLANDPVRLLAAVGGPDLAATAGFLLQAAVRRTPVVLDGIVSGAAALFAACIAPSAKAWWIAGHVSAEPAHGEALRHLGLNPLLDLGLRLGEGTGALLALPLIQAASATLNEMATFSSAGVSGRA
jgi:nicotinate-nucleotide--dimethylbenzimidazole phosphoribosyltransferase